jgi:hypothetical protein
MKSSTFGRLLTCTLGLAVMAGAVGCQSDFNGQTLPSAWWQNDDVQYFPPGHEFKLMNEAIAMQAAKRPAGLVPMPSAVGPGGMPLAPAPGPGVLPGPAPIGGPAPIVAPPGEVLP